MGERLSVRASMVVGEGAPDFESAAARSVTVSDEEDASGLFLPQLESVAEAAFYPPPRLSQSLWGIDWNDYCPVDVGGGISVEVVAPGRCMEFVRDRCPNLFGTANSAFSPDVMTPAKARYFNTVADCFAFEKEGEVVGLFVGNPEDWSSYYVRAVAIEERYQRRGLYARFFDTLCRALEEHGVERVETDTALSNTPAQTALGRLSFVVEGTLATDRWGAVIRYVKYLCPKRGRVFFCQFCAGGAQHRAKVAQGQAVDKNPTREQSPSQERRSP